MSGEVDKIKGRTKQAAGALTDDENLQKEGERDEAAGKVKDGVNSVKKAADDAVDAVVDKLK
jgi:uncharacterized protein YjbJ (UPF0337 family)